VHVHVQIEASAKHSEATKLGVGKIRETVSTCMT
jgi:hypothetical protein